MFAEIHTKWKVSSINFERLGNQIQNRNATQKAQDVVCFFIRWSLFLDFFGDSTFQFWSLGNLREKKTNDLSIYNDIN